MRRLARWCFGHRAITIGAWVVALIALTAIHSGVGSAYSNNFDLPHTQSFEAIKLLEQPGMSLRKVAGILGTSRETIHRLAQQERLILQTSQKLTAEQREEAFLLLEGGMSLRGVAKRFGVNPESLRRLVKRHTS